MKSYLKLSIIRKLPLYVVLSVLLITVAFTSATSVDFRPNYYPYVYPQSGISGLLSLFFMIMVFLPFFSMNYRYSLARSDLYRQVGIKDNKIRIGEHLASLIIVSIAYTIAFTVLVSTLLIRNYGKWYDADPAFYLNYSWYIPLYFVSLIAGACQYFISYFLISRSNTFINSLLILLIGEFALNFTGYVLVTYFSSDITTGVLFVYGPSILGPMANITSVFDELIDYGTNYYESQYSNSGLLNLVYTSVIVMAVQFVAAAALGLFALIKEKDPSSEWAGKPDTDKPYQEIIYHVGFGVLGLVIGTSMIDSFFTMIYALIYYTTYIAVYYTLYGLLHRNFKLKARQAAILFGVGGGAIIFCISYTIIRAIIIAATVNG